MTLLFCLLFFLELQPITAISSVFFLPFSFTTSFDPPPLPLWSQELCFCTSDLTSGRVGFLHPNFRGWKYGIHRGFGLFRVWESSEGMEISAFLFLFLIAAFLLGSKCMLVLNLHLYVETLPVLIQNKQ